MSQVQNGSPPKASTTPWSLRIVTLFGIPIRLHFTFLLFLVYLVVVGLQGQGSWVWPVLVITLFGCVLLHEIGHALVALQYHVRTRDITLYPIGGLALLQDRPTPKQELVIALAGPAVNLVIGGALFVVIRLQGINLAVPAAPSSSFLVDVMKANLLLAAFNLIPAFPMDGGRVLRSALAIYTDFNRATQIAAGIGQGLAFALGLAGFLSQNFVLVFIAVLVFFGAGQEASLTTARSFLEGHTVGDAMQSRYLTITHAATLDTAATMLLQGGQHEFPVLSGEEPVGLITSSEIARGLSDSDGDAYVAQYMDREIQTIGPSIALTEAFELFNQTGARTMFVMDEENLVGVLTRDSVSEFIMLEAARHHGKPRSGSAAPKMTDQ
jgi:Zn-dependent protease/CBS domain-containing protein